MKRFDFNNEPNDEPFDEEDDEKMEEVSGPEVIQEFIDGIGLDLVDKQLRIELYKTAERICRQEWFWRFRSVSSKLKRIDKAYRRIVSLVNQERK
jgi:hypothetical protein